MERKKNYEYMQEPTHPELDDMNNYRLLAVAIVQNAAEEYMNAYRKRWKHSLAPNSDRARQLDRTIKVNEDFFDSEWFDILTNGEVNANALVDRLQYLALNTNKKKFRVV